jgi:branched-chain amino acid transport system permease protein
MTKLATLFITVLAPLLLITLIDSPWLNGAATSSLILMIMVVGLHLFCGNSGVLAFGHVAFVAIGAYTCGILTVPALVKPAIFPNLPIILAQNSVPPQVGVLVGGVVAGAAATILFYPLRKLNTQALSIVTLSLLLIANIFFTNVRLSSSGGSIFRVPLAATLWNVVPWLLGALLVALLFQQSRLGLRLRASREDEFAAESGGIDIGWTRLVAFVVSAAIMGVAGGLYALSIGSFSAADFYIDLTILLFAMMVVGGMRSLSGAVIGTSIISIVSYSFSKLQNGFSFGDFTFHVPAGTANVSIALCMIVVLLFRNEGLMGDREINFANLFSKFKRN